MKTSIANPNGEKSLKIFAEKLRNIVDNKIDVNVKLVYRDMGLGIKHYTIVAMNKENNLSRFQALNPRQLRMIEEGTYTEELVNEIADKINSLLLK